jgi:hypothetical protein
MSSSVVLGPTVFVLCYLCFFCFPFVSFSLLACNWLSSCVKTFSKLFLLTVSWFISCTASNEYRLVNCEGGGMK